MSTAQLQLTITSQVLAIKDENLLQQVLEFLQKKPVKTKKKKKINIGDPEHPYYNKLTPSEIEGVNESMEDYNAGRFTTLSTLEEIENHFKAL